MKFTLAILSVAGAVAAQGVTSQISPPGATPSGCSASADGTQFISIEDITNAPSKRDVVVKRQTADACTGGDLVVTLANGVLTDSKGRTGYIAANYQFQFDEPPQTGAIYTAGFSVCQDNIIALGENKTFWACQSGSFANLYNADWAPQCTQVQMVVNSCDQSDPPGQAGQGGDGQPIATQILTTTIVSAIGDGQPQAITTTVPIPICQISDGQAQVVTTPCASVSATPTSTSSVSPVCQISDGQVQATPCPSVSPVCQGSDGQVQASCSATPVPVPSPTATVSPVCQISDGQVQASCSGTPAPPVSASPTPVSNGTISTKPQPPPVTSSSSPASSTPTPISSGAGHVEMGSLAALVIGFIGAVAFL